MYAKLFGSLLMSSVWSESQPTRILWITMMAAANREGEVFGSPVGLAAMARLTLDETLAGLEKLKNPEPHSSDRTRNPENEGRRIEEISGGWRLLNYIYYRDLASAEERREQWKAAKRRERATRKSSNVSDMSTVVSNVLPSESYSESESKDNIALSRSEIERVHEEQSVKYPADFAEWWLAYSPPSRRLGKGAAAKIWARLTTADRRKAMSALPAFKESNRGKEDRFVCLAPTYLSQRRFDDFDGAVQTEDPKIAAGRKMLADSKEPK